MMLWRYVYFGLLEVAGKDCKWLGQCFYLATDAKTNFTRGLVAWNRALGMIISLDIESRTQIYGSRWCFGVLVLSSLLYVGREVVYNCCCSSDERHAHVM